MFGYESVEEVLAADPASLGADPAVRERLYARTHEQGELDDTEVEFSRKDGSTFTGLLSGTIERGEDGEIQCYDGIVTDISRQRRRERKLRERDRQLRQIRKNVNEVIWMSPADKSEIEFISEAYEDIWGRPTEELKERPNSVVEAIHPKDREQVRGALKVQKQNPEAYEETYRVVQPDGTIRWVHDRSAGVYDENGELERIVGIAIDITKRRRLQERLLELQAEERRRTTQYIHDEMGGLLASLQFTVDLARMEAEKKDASTGHFDEIADLVNKLSTLARRISRKLYPSDLSDYGLRESLSSLVSEMEEQYSLKVELHSDLGTEKRLSSLLERTAYWIIHEALENVAHHAEIGKARVEVKQRENQLFLQVSDEGIGFDSSTIGGESTRGGEKNLGLEGIRRRAERLDGEIEIDTEPGRGTQLSAELPLRGASRSQKPPEP